MSEFVEGWKVKKSLFLSMLLSVAMCADTLRESIIEVLDNNPVVQERLKNFRATQQDIHVAESEYLPSLDLQGEVGQNAAGNILDKVRDADYTKYSATLTLTQNLFNGFGTMYKVDYQEARILAAAYSYLEKANDIAFQMTRVYLDVLKEHDLLGTATQNVQINQSIYNKVQSLYDSGLTTFSEVQKIRSSLSLAKANLVAQQNNVKDAEYRYRKVFGRMPQYQQMQRPKLDTAMPESLQRAGLYAIGHNPSLLVAHYDIQGAQALYKQRQKDYYPSIDLQASQTVGDYSGDYNTFDSPDDRTKVKLVLNYNLYRGGADDAEVQKNISKIAQETEIYRDLKRQVVEGLDLSWNAYEMTQRQLSELYEYKGYADSTLELYKEEYDLGRRSLLDLLSSQNDVIRAREEIIRSENALLFAKYRILDAMGLLPTVVLEGSAEYTKKVGLAADKEFEEVLDTLPVTLDADHDQVVDSIDLCDNSKSLTQIMPYGCMQKLEDADGDEVTDVKDKCPFTPKGVKVDENGCALDSDLDGIADNLDSCQDTPFGYNVDVEGCATSVDLYVNFKYKSTQIGQKAYKELEQLAEYLKDRPYFKVQIIGHTDSVASEVYNQKLSEKRAKSTMDALIKLGVDPKRMTSEGRGESEPVADESTPEGAFLNRRVEVKLIKE